MDLTMTAWAGIIKKFTSLLTEQYSYFYWAV